MLYLTPSKSFPLFTPFFLLSLLGMACLKFLYEVPKNGVYGSMQIDPYQVSEGMMIPSAAGLEESLPRSFPTSYFQWSNVWLPTMNALLFRECFWQSVFIPTKRLNKPTTFPFLVHPDIKGNAALRRSSRYHWMGRQSRCSQTEADGSSKRLQVLVGKAASKKEEPVAPG